MKRYFLSNLIVRTLVVVCVFIFSGAAIGDTIIDDINGPAENISIDKVFSTLSAQIQNLRSLEIKGVVTTDIPNSRGKPRNLTPEEQQSFQRMPKKMQEDAMKVFREGSIERKELHFRFEGNKFALSMDRKEWTGSFDNFENASLVIDNDTARAFNGKQYQFLQNGIMRVSSKETFAGRHPSDPYFIEAFKFARTAKTPGHVTLDWLRKKDAWEQLKQHAVIVGRQKVGEYPCIVVELVIPNLNSRGKVITRRVYLGEDLGFFPVRYESMLGEEHTQVNEFEAENVRRFQGPDGESFHMFAKSTFTVLKNTGELLRIIKSEIDLDSLVYNADLPDSEFNLPLVGVIEYRDLDNPKNNFRVHEGNNSWNTRIEVEEPSYAMIGSQAPDFTLDKLGSGRVTLSQVKEKVIVLDFWSTWCRPCITGIHELERVHKWVRDNKKSVAFYCININKAPSVVAKFWKAKGFSLPVLLDKDLAVAKSYKTVGIPHMVIISDGTIRHVHIGGAKGPEMLKIQHDQLKNEIATLLSE